MGRGERRVHAFSISPLSPARSIFPFHSLFYLWNNSGTLNGSETDPTITRGRHVNASSRHELQLSKVQVILSDMNRYQTDTSIGQIETVGPTGVCLIPAVFHMALINSIGNGQ